VRECRQKFIFHLGFVTQEIDEGLAFVEQVSNHVLIATSVKGDSGDACEGFYSNRPLYERCA
jgi:hypothetical protein